jgi:hypothetical protein
MAMNRLKSVQFVTEMQRDMRNTGHDSKLVKKT